MFDIVITRYSAHHWQNLTQAINEVKRVLKSSGKLIVVDTISCNEPLFDTFIQAIELIRDPSHVRNYSLKEWIAIAEHAGFETKNIEKQSIKLNLEVWTTRMHTPQESINTIRKLQMMACDQVKAYYEIDEVGNFQNYVGYLVFTH